MLFPRLEKPSVGKYFICNFDLQKKKKKSNHHSKNLCVGSGTSEDECGGERITQSRLETRNKNAATVKFRHSSLGGTNPVGKSDKPSDNASV